MPVSQHPLGMLNCASLHLPHVRIQCGRSAKPPVHVQPSLNPCPNYLRLRSSQSAFWDADGEV